MSVPAAHLGADAASRELDFCFTVRNRRGLGHYMRSATIASALLRHRSALRIGFVVRRQPPASMSQEGVRTYCAENAPSSRVWVHDTVAPKSVDDVAADAHVLVMRAGSDEFESERLARVARLHFDLIVVPHSLREWRDPPELLDSSSSRLRVVGPIVREPNNRCAPRLRRRYGIGSETFVVVSTLGGGGFEKDAERFFSIIHRVHAALAVRRTNLRHIVVAGPHCDRLPRETQCMSVVHSETNLPALFSLAHLVVSAAGYNTVNELRVAQAPAVLLPGERGLDDQFARAHRMESKGLARVADLDDADRATDAIVALAESEEARRQIQAAHRRQPIRDGNDLAASLMLELLS